MNLYSERLAVLAVGVPIFKKIGIGSALRWHELTIRGCGTLNVLSIDAGTQLKYSEKFRLAAFFRNLTGASLTDFSDDLPRGGEIAVAYWPLNGSVVTCGAEKYSLQDTAFSIAIEQRIFNFFDLRCGFKTGVARFSAGYGFRWKGIRFEQGFVYQEFLGPQTLFTVSFFAPPAQGPHKLDLPYQDKGLYTGEKLNINTASERDLLLLPKIGKSVAKNIISYRIEHGFFRKIDDIMNVKRIGPKTFEKIRNYITVGESFSLKPAKKNLGIATENDLISLGIPPMTAVRIIKWKGGRVKFHSIKELRTVEGITDDDLKVIKECFEFEEENDLP